MDANPSVLEIISSELNASLLDKSQERGPLEQPNSRPGGKALVEQVREMKRQENQVVSLSWITLHLSICFNHRPAWRGCILYLSICGSDTQLQLILTWEF